MKNILFIILLSITACTPPQQADLHASSSAASSTLPPSKWPSSAFPLNVKISTDFDNDEFMAIEDMADAWSDSVDHSISFIRTGDSTSPKGSNLGSYVDSLIGVYRLDTWPSELPGTALAVTQIYGTRKNVGKSSEYIRIDHADILVNYENYGFTTDYSWGFDLQTIVLHEMGHLLGLYHDESSVEESVMFPTITRYVDNRYPLDRDIGELKSKYGLNNSGSGNRQSFRTPASSQDESEVADTDEAVIIQFEIMADGEENFKIIKR